MCVHKGKPSNIQVKRTSHPLAGQYDLAVGWPAFVCGFQPGGCWVGGQQVVGSLIVLFICGEALLDIGHV